MKVEIRQDEDGEWVELLVNGEHRYGGHSVPKREWVALLKDAGVEVVKAEGLFNDGGDWVPA